MILYSIDPGPVNSLMAISPSPSSFLITWDQSSANNCPEDGYYCRYTLVNRDQCEPVDEDWTDSPATSDLRTGLSGLQPYSTYNVSVSAYNSAGEGVETYIIRTTNITGNLSQNKCFLNADKQYFHNSHVCLRAFL